jgi:hypothetical protein
LAYLPPLLLVSRLLSHLPAFQGVPGNVPFGSSFTSVENAYRVARITARPRAVIIGQFIEYALSNFVVSLSPFSAILVQAET